MPPGLLEFLKKNAKFLYGGGILGTAFVASDVKRIADADNKFKALLKTLKDFLIVRIAFAATMTGIAKGLQAIVRESGSLDAALRKLQSTQTAARGLAPFVGGLEAARKKIAELYTVASKSPFKFEDIAEANKSLAVFTKGAYSSTEAIKTLTAAATVTGSNVQDVANAVGMFYDNLSSGQPIDRSAESLRQLGVVSNSTAQQLTAMAEGGASITSIMSVLDAALQKTAQSAKGYGDEVANVTTEHQKAIEAFQEAIGAPFTAAETKNVQNMSAAMRAITPTVGQVAKSLASVFSSFQTVTSGIAKFLAQSKTAQQVMLFLGKAIQVAAIALTVFGLVTIPSALRAVASLSVGIGNWALKMGLALKYVVPLTAGLQALGTVAVGTFAVAGIAALIGVLINAKRQAHEADQKFKDWKKSLRDTTSSIEEQIAGIKNLADKNAALNKILADQIELEKDLAKQRGSSKEGPEARKLEKLRTEHPEKIGTEEERAQIDKVKEEQKKLADERGEIESGRSKLQKLEADRRRVSGETGGIRGSERAVAKLDKEIAQEKASIKAKEQAIQKRKEEYSEVSKISPVQEKLIEAEVRRSQLIDQQTLGIEEREKRATTGAKISAAAEETRSGIDAKRLDMEKELEKDKAKFEEDRKKSKAQGGLTHEEKVAAKKDFADRQQAVDQLKKDSIQAAFDVAAAQGEAGKQSSAYLGAQLEQMDAAKRASEKEAKLKVTTDPKDKKALQEEIDSLKELSGGATYTAPSYFEKKKEVEKAKAREAEMPELQAELPKVRAERVGFQTETQAELARAAGNIPKAFKLEDLAKYQKTFEQLKPTFGPEAAQKMATERTQADIKSQYAQAGNVVGFLQSVGGGGGLPQQGVDLQRRMVELLSSINEYNKVMAGGQPTDQQGQPTPAFFFNP
jgi:hypothetical protein